MTSSNKYYPDSQQDREHFCDNLALFRKRKELSQSQLAEQINTLKGTRYSLKNISSWESGTALPPLTLLPALAFILDVPILTFFKKEDFKATDAAKAIDAHEQLPTTWKERHTADPERAFNELLQELEQVKADLAKSEEARKLLEDKQRQLEKIFRSYKS